MINADKPHLWKQDVATSVDLFNDWFMQFAPLTYRETRVRVTGLVEEALRHVRDMHALTPAAVRAKPEILPILRMSTAPPIARDRLTGLARLPGSATVNSLEAGKIPRSSDLDAVLTKICDIIGTLLDKDLFPWINTGNVPTEGERFRASTIIADRLCGSQSNPIIRNAQEQRQLLLIERFLTERGYRHLPPLAGRPITDMEPRTFTFRLNIPAHSKDSEKWVKIPIDAVIQPTAAHVGDFPLLIEAKSAGDYTNTNKRRKEEGKKIDQLRNTYGEDVRLTLFLCGYFDTGYLGYEAGERLDWVWEHRIEDLLQLGI